MPEHDQQRALVGRLVELLDARRRSLMPVPKNRPSRSYSVRDTRGLTRYLRHSSWLTDIERPLRLASLTQTLALPASFTQLSARTDLSRSLSAVVLPTSSTSIAGITRRHASLVSDTASALRSISPVRDALVKNQSFASSLLIARGVDRPLLPDVLRSSTPVVRFTGGAEFVAALGAVRGLMSGLPTAALSGELSKWLTAGATGRSLAPMWQLNVPPNFLSGLVTARPSPFVLSQSIVASLGNLQLPHALTGQRFPALASELALFVADMSADVAVSLEGDAASDGETAGDFGLASSPSRREGALAAAYELGSTLLVQAAEGGRVAATWLWQVPLWWAPSLFQLWPSMTSVERKKVRDQAGLVAAALIMLAAEVSTGLGTLAVLGTLVGFSFTLSQLYRLVEELESKYHGGRG